MKFNFSSMLVAGFLISASMLSSVAHAGYIVVNSDEWTLANAGYDNAGAANVNSFINNITNLFTGDAPGNFLAYSSNFALTESRLAASMTSAGHSWTVNSALSFDLATLSAYNGIFLADNTADQNVILDYLAQGGNVYIAAGTGGGGPVNEANQWNTVLASIGLQFQSSYNGITETLAPVSADPLMVNVNNLYFDNGNTIVDMDLENSRTNGEIFFSHNGSGLLAVGSFGQLPNRSVFTPDNVANVPEPATLAIFALGIIGLATRRFVKKS